MKYFL